MHSKTRKRPALRFIPFRKRDVVEMCVASGELKSSEQLHFRELCRLLQSVFHFEYHEKLEILKDAYAPLNPDRDTRKLGVFGEPENLSFVEQMREVLDKANYEQLTDADLQKAFRESSLFRLALHIDFSDFDEVLLFARGESFRTEKVGRFMGLFKRDLEFSNFDRVVIYIKFSETMQSLKIKNRPGSSMLKLFQNVPRADLEMLFPNTRVGMRLVDKMMIGIPAVVGGGIVVTTKLGTSLLLLGTLLGFWLGLHSTPVEIGEAALIALALGLGTLGSFIWRQFVNFKNRKLQFMQALTENLYFKNLDNNAGVFYRLIDDAEEEECKEAMLGYYFLLTAGHPLTEQDLDARIEQWFMERWDCKLDFEIEDAMAKLIKFGLAKHDGEHLSVVPLDAACEILDGRWDEYFNYNIDHLGR